MLRRLATLALVLVVATSAMGCRSRRLGPTVPTRADARWQRRLEGLARRELGCRAVRVIALNDSVWQADGCGNLMEYELLCAGRHCSWHRIEPAALRASRDFACPLTSLSAAVPSATRRDLSGCGRAASYTLTCGANHCEWQSYGATGAAAAPVAYGSAIAVPPPPGASVGDESLADVIIPPPPGAAPPPGAVAPAVAAEPPQAIIAVPAPGASTAPGTPDVPAPEAPPPASDDIVIPPPPR